MNAHPDPNEINGAAPRDDHGADGGNSTPPTTDEQKAPDPAPPPAGATEGEQQPAGAGAQGTRLDASVEAAIDAAMEKISEEAAPAGHAAPASPKPAIRGPRVVQGGREHRHGRVVSVGPEDVFVEFGPKELGVVPRAQFKDDKLPEVGADLEVVIDRYSTDEQLYMCLVPGAIPKAEWELLEPGQVVEATVTGHNKGGLELVVANHRAFMPASQIDVQRINDLAQFKDQKLTCKVLRVDRMGRGNITLSRRAVLEEQKQEQAEKLKQTLKEGDVVEGTVRKIMPFGAFVDIGGIDGLLHISDLSHDRVNKVEEVLKEGDSVQVKILRLDWEKNRHSLGLKQLTPDPFEEALKEIPEGEIVSGKVTKLMDFGAFIEVAPGVEGLAHISELSWQRVAKVSDAVQPNAVVQVKVLKIDKENKKVSLSIKQAKDRPQPRGGQRGGRRGRRDEDTRKPEEILKETPQLRRMREKAKQRERSGAGGLGEGLGMGLGDLKLD